MKTHQLILLTTVLFVTLFYGEEMGVNFGLLGVAYALLTLIHTPEENRTRAFVMVFVAGILSSVAFAWYGDFASFLAVFTSLFLLSFKSKNRDLKSLLVIPVFAVNFGTFIYRFFKFEDWLPKRNMPETLKKVTALFLIPLFFVLVFFGVYALGSEHFSGFFSGWKFSFDLWQFIVLGTLGFFVAFNFWNFKIEKFIFSLNHHFKNDFLNEDKEIPVSGSFLDIDSERMSGVISFVALNILLLVFIFTFNYEQFVEVPKSPSELSVEIHDRVNAVILSIVMAVLVIMFYFKGKFNFDRKAGTLKLLAKIWIFLNAVLVISAFAKNSEYVLSSGITYKRLGVYAFMVLAFIGLIFTFIKIKHQKTNAFMFNQMSWYFYGTVLATSFINWGNLATVYNITNDKGSFDFYKSLNYNDELLIKTYPNEFEKTTKPAEIANEQSKTFLSKIIYYQTLKPQK
ncbi:DUF4173 domain-containing protein [Kaistella faecalis]|uniref:DUF4153 domain-containing protein n=1 Tax=Kaistella faecalis TaxID=2852098 RepID=UPI001C45B1BA|nr:DUF4173 domain-containing protein [Chryseobacterium faecale]UFK98815.1 DUF4173 domain-containing protein [Chryseobacterium faecale]